MKPSAPPWHASKNSRMWCNSRRRMLKKHNITVRTPSFRSGCARAERCNPGFSGLEAGTHLARFLANLAPVSRAWVDNVRSALPLARWVVCQDRRERAAANASTADQYAEMQALCRGGGGATGRESEESNSFCAPPAPALYAQHDEAASRVAEFGVSAILGRRAWRKAAPAVRLPSRRGSPFAAVGAEASHATATHGSVNVRATVRET